MLNDSRKARQDEQEIEQIKALHKEHRAYGYRRMAIAMNFSKNKAHRLMKIAGLKSVIRKKRFQRYTSAVGIGIVVPNHMKRDFKTTGPNKKIHCDISYVKAKKENGLAPFHYLKYLFEKLPNIDLQDQKSLDELLPWSESLPEECRVKKN